MLAVSVIRNPRAPVPYLTLFSNFDTPALVSLFALYVQDALLAPRNITLVLQSSSEARLM